MGNKKRNYQVIIASDYRRTMEGGFPQRLINGVITWPGCRKETNFIVDDQSCGTLGKRYAVAFFRCPIEFEGVYTTDKLVFKEEDIPDQSTFKPCKALHDIRKVFKEVTGYDFLMKDEIAA